MSMGLLDDICKGRASWSPGAIFFWLVVGGLVGFGADRLIGSGYLGLVFVVCGMLAGLAVGLFAAFGTSRMARVLAAPGEIIDAFL
jgi:hypothetical protein